jgi:pimeloyl-ACP methyl ester carboxylesterase
MQSGFRIADIEHARLESAIPGARLAILPGVGHVSNLEAAAAFNAMLREFLLTHSGS